jgi:hypothetical protein
MRTRHLTREPLLGRSSLVMIGMKKRIVKVGVVVIVVGVVLVGIGRLGALNTITFNMNFTQPHLGEYVSAEITLNSASDLIVSSPATVGGIVHAQDLNLVNSTDVSAYAIPHNATAAGSDLYPSLSGDFYYVAFSSTQPITSIVGPQANVGSLAYAYGELALVGGVCTIAGIIVAALGLRQKNRTEVAMRV